MRAGYGDLPAVSLHMMNRIRALLERLAVIGPKRSEPFCGPNAAYRSQDHAYGLEGRQR